jgi:glucose/arabinose dehydrogenase
MNTKIICLLLLAFSIKASALVSKDKIFKSQTETFKVETLTSQKDVIWGFDFISDHEIIFTERSGVLKLLNLKTKNVSEISGAPLVRAKGQGGLLDVAVNPNKKNEVYLSFSNPQGQDKASTSVGYGIIEGSKLKSFKTIFTAYDANDENIHFGSRIVFDGKGYIYFSVGDRDEREKAQSLSFHNGKIMRLKVDGSVPEDNPFFTTKDAKPEIWSLGHRNPQGLVFDKLSGKLWEAEFGPRGGDELNLIERGGNYGWPRVTYGREYWGPSIGVKELKGFIAPVEHWVPSISPSGLMIYSGKQFKNWSGNIFLANLSGSHIRRLKIENNKVLVQEVLLDSLGARFRQVKEGQEGHIYFSTDDGNLARIILAN